MEHHCPRNPKASVWKSRWHGTYPDMRLAKWKGRLAMLMVLSSHMAAQGRKYCSFLDPGRKLLGQGSGEVNVENRLVHVGGTRFMAENTGGHVNEDYPLAMVAPFPSDREKFAAERLKSKASWI